jgi:hypothetical protein
MTGASSDPVLRHHGAVAMPATATLLDLEPELSKVTDPTTPRPPATGIEEIYATGPSTTLEPVEDCCL